MYNFSARIEDLIVNHEKYHQCFQGKARFTGPSLYFHQIALDELKQGISRKSLEYVYAALTSWGMHRMGMKGAKMAGFHAFYDSVVDKEDLIKELHAFKIQDFDKWDLLGDLFLSIKVMETRTILIGNSKVLAHLIPNLVAPIDREYTLKFIYGNKNIPSDLEKQKDIFISIIRNFFKPLSESESITNYYNSLTKPDNPWDTSLVKHLDNLIIGASS